MPTIEADSEEQRAWARVRQQHRPQMVVLSGPSGAGKDELLTYMRLLAFPFYFPVTVTTRLPRPSERNGVDYHFFTVEQYNEWVAGDQFLERAVVYGNFYGVPKSEVREALEQGRDVIMRIDVQGAAHIRAIAPDAILIFLVPPDIETLARRLRQRGSEDELSLALRMQTVHREMAELFKFDYVVVNYDDRQDEAARQIMAIIEAEKQRVAPRRVRL
jgi:guanylate kinase